MAHNITIYTDGSSQGNPGRGGYGIILISGKHRKEISQGFVNTTNNRMELLAVIVALEALKYNNCNVNIYTDSKYVVDAVEKKWLVSWQKNGFKKKKNPDLWKRFLNVYEKHNVRFHWIKGHNNHPENERCDRLAVEAGNKNNLLVDEGYVNDDENKLFE